MAKGKTKNYNEPDGLYFLKLVLYFLLGCLWLNIGDSGYPVPIGLALGLLFASHDHFKIDRKVELAVLLIACILSFFAPIGFVLQIS